MVKQCTTLTEHNSNLLVVAQEEILSNTDHHHTYDGNKTHYCIANHYVTLSLYLPEFLPSTQSYYGDDSEEQLRRNKKYK